MKYLILLLIISCAFGGEVKLSPVVEKALMQFDVETLKAKVEHDKKIVELKKGLITKLEREMSVASQAGDLDLAVAIKEVKDGLVNEITPKVTPVKKKPTVQQLGQQLVDGTWYFKGLAGHRFIKFMPNGTIADGVNEHENTFKITDDLTLVFFQENKSIQSKFTFNEETNVWKQVWPVGVSWGPQSVTMNP